MAFRPSGGVPSKHVVTPPPRVADDVPVNPGQGKPKGKPK